MLLEQTNAIGAEPKDDSHQFARALFQLRLNLKALAAVTGEDGAIAHPSGVSINCTAFHCDALDAVCRSSAPHLRASFNQVVACFSAVPGCGDGTEFESVLRAIRTNLKNVADHLNARPFTNDRRMVASMICAETCDLSELAIKSFAVRHFVKIES